MIYQMVSIQKQNKKVNFKNNAPFTSCNHKINDAFMDSADIVT